MQRLDLTIDSMNCGHCVARVGRALAALEGVRVGDVRIGSARLEFEPARVTVDRIIGALAEAGYAATATEGIAG